MEQHCEKCGGTWVELPDRLGRVSCPHCSARYMYSFEETNKIHKEACKRVQEKLKWKGLWQSW